MQNEQETGWMARWEQERMDTTLMKRIATHDLNDLKVFIAQKLFKVDGIAVDEQTRLMLIEKMLVQESQPTLSLDEMQRRYG